MIRLPTAITLALLITAVSTASLFGVNLEGTRYETNGEIEDVKHLLFYRDQDEGELIYEDVSQNLTNVDPGKPVVVILHGFMGSPHAKSTRLLIEGYVNRSDSNVIGVDWNQLAQGPWYSSAADGAVEAAHQLAHWVEEVVSTNRTTFADIHIVGFSLGCQVAGMTTKFLKGKKVGRITGLDPAKPLFDGKPASDRLDKEDADFVSVVHSCGGFLAFSDPVGHVDFYPNGGVNPQPPCNAIVMKQEQSNPMLQGANRGATKAFASLVCSHYVSLSLWVQSLRPEAEFKMTHCQSWPSFLSKKCSTSPSGHKDLIMGEATPKSARGTYYMQTEDTKYMEAYSSQISDLITEGLQEYSKLFLGDVPEQDRGQAEIQEVKQRTTEAPSTTAKTLQSDDEQHLTNEQSSGSNGRFISPISCCQLLLSSVFLIVISNFSRLTSDIRL